MFMHRIEAFGLMEIFFTFAFVLGLFSLGEALKTVPIRYNCIPL